MSNTDQMLDEDRDPYPQGGDPVVDEAAQVPQGAVPDSMAAQQWGVQQAGVVPPHEALRNTASKLLAYLHGDGAAPPQAVQQAAQQVDPQGTMSEGDRNLAVIKAAGEQGGPEAAWSVVQSNRVQYNAKMAFAKAALTGVQGKPPDVNAAAQAATQAYAHMPDGTDVRFTPSTGGVTAAVTSGGKAQTFHLTPQQFAQWLDVGKQGMFDSVYEGGGAAQTLPKLGARPVQAAPAAGPSQSSSPSPGRQPQKLGGENDTANSYNPPAPGKDPYYHDPNFDDDLVSTSRRIFPQGSMEGQRMQWLHAHQTQRDQLSEANENKVAVAKVHGDAVREGAGLRAGATIKSSENRKEGVIQAADIKSKAGRDQAAAKLQQIAVQSRDNAERNAARLLVSKLATGQSLTKQEEERANQMLKGTVAPAASPQGTGGAGQKVKMKLPDGRTVYVQG